MKSLVLSFFLFFSSLQLAYSQCSSAVLEGFGSISAVAIYNTYITIGSVADAYVGELYEADYVITLMDEQKSMIGVVKKSLDACISDTSDEGLSEDDKLYLEQLITCLSYLEDEAKGLSNYAMTGEQSALDDYSTGRDNAWELISLLLGLDE